jgi:hypothetical protein
MNRPSLYTQAEYDNQQDEDMSATTELFEQYKLRIGAHADSAGAAALGIKSQTVSNWRTRGSQAEPWLIEKMTMALGVDATEWLVRVQVEQSHDASNKDVWRRVGKQLGYKIAEIAVLISPAVPLGRRAAKFAEDLGYEVPAFAIATNDWLLAFA